MCEHHMSKTKVRVLNDRVSADRRSESNGRPIYEADQIIADLITNRSKNIDTGLKRMNRS